MFNSQGYGVMISSLTTSGTWEIYLSCHSPTLFIFLSVGLLCFHFGFPYMGGYNNSDNLTEMLYGLNEIMSLKQLSQCLTYHNLSIQVNYYGYILTKAVLICNQKGICEIP